MRSGPSAGESPAPDASGTATEPDATTSAASVLTQVRLLVRRWRPRSGYPRDPPSQRRFPRGELGSPFAPLVSRRVLGAGTVGKLPRRRQTWRLPCSEEQLTRRALITGITGQDGSYLAEHLADLGYEVWGLIRGQANPRVQPLRQQVGDVRLVRGDLLDQGSLI